VLHGYHVAPADDTMGLGTGDDTKTYWGAPYFTGWPKWHTTTHQQVYYKWLERAWQGGMRVMVMLAVNNEFACATSKHLRGTNCSWSMPGIDAQLDAAIAFQSWHEKQPGGGWFKIVKSADEAEQVIRSGKLAVILGIESDVLFGCKTLPYVAGSTNQTYSRQSCTPEFVNGQVDKYFAKGVRYIFPVHDFDTWFSGTALFIGALGVANVTITGSTFGSAPCPGISDKLGCNVRGLSPGAGPAFLDKLMDQGWLIDLDHMSAKGIEDTFALARARGGYPFFIGHGLFNELYAAGKNRHERMRTAAQLAQLKAFGSVVSVMTQDELEAGQTRCMHSSVSFGQNLTYAASKMDVVAFGSDFNGFAPHVGPRFGPEACGRNAQQGRAQGTIAANGLSYPITVPGFGVFDRQVTGQRTFDFNTDGLAHIGLYPDLLADLTRQGISIEPLMKSAALVVSAWRKASGSKPAPPPPSKAVLPPPPAKLTPTTPVPTIKKL
jgi:microsomal dipeptidase-like Zn-dependent dipeptidase